MSYNSDEVLYLIPGNPPSVNKSAHTNIVDKNPKYLSSFPTDLQVMATNLCINITSALPQVFSLLLISSEDLSVYFVTVLLYTHPFSVSDS